MDMAKNSVIGSILYGAYILLGVFGIFAILFVIYLWSHSASRQVMKATVQVDYQKAKAKSAGLRSRYRDWRKGRMWEKLAKMEDD
jgi:hypothetical protein